MSKKLKVGWKPLKQRVARKRRSTALLIKSVIAASKEKLQYLNKKLMIEVKC